MKQIKKEDLKVGETYFGKTLYDRIIKITNISENSLSAEGLNLNLKMIFNYYNNYFKNLSILRLATPEEKHWLETCISAGKFIDYKNIMIKEPKSKFLSGNTVQNKEGAIFTLRDVITPTIDNSLNKGKPFEIIGFRWNTNKTEICAITEVHTPYGIGIDKIELYSKNVVLSENNKTNLQNEFISFKLTTEIKDSLSINNNKETLLDKAKRLYPIGTKFMCVNKNDINNLEKYSIVEKYDDFHKNLGIFTAGKFNSGSWICFYNKWAEIIEYPHGFKVGDIINSNKKYPKFVGKKDY